MVDSLSKGERTSQQIANAAFELFIEQGFHGTSMRQIARRAGIALGGIYNHFESKEQIFNYVLLEKHPYRQVLDILQSTPGDSVDALAYNAARTMLAELGRRPSFLKLVFIELSEFKGQHVPILFKTIFPQFLPLIERFKASQHNLRELPSEIVLLSFLGTFFACYLTESLVHPSESVFLDRPIIDYYIDIYLHGILEAEPQ
jgi:AcrR family transcriptional regulator